MKYPLIINIFLFVLMCSCNTQSESNDENKNLSTQDAVMHLPDTYWQVNDGESTEITKPITTIPHAQGINDPLCETKCPGFYEKQGTWYFDGNKRPEAEMIATCSIDAAGMCCLQMKGSLGDVILAEEIVIETKDGMLPAVMPVESEGVSFELTDDGDTTLLILNILEGDQIAVNYAYTR